MKRPLVAVFGSSQTQPDQPDWADGVWLGRTLVEGGAGVVTGGYGGLMEAVSQGAAEAGGAPVGITSPEVFPDRSGANRYVETEHQSPTLPQRIAHIVELSDAAIAMPGSIGTLTELIVAWNDAFIAPYSGQTPKPVIAVGEAWRQIVTQVVELVGADGSLVMCVDSVQSVPEILEGRLAGFSRPVG
jgi:uncharacterized protein (TIGR00730 family)